MPFNTQYNKASRELLMWHSSFTKITPIQNIYSLHYTLWLLTVVF